MIRKFAPADRLNLPVYPFAELESKAAEIMSSGKTLYDLSIGDPDLPPPGFITEAVRRSLNDPRSHYYPSSRGDYQVRSSVCRWFEGRFGVELDPNTQVCILIGAKEGLSHLARAVVNPGDQVAFPEPGYPVYGRAGCSMLQATQKVIQLNSEDGFLPSLEHLKGVKLLYLNYPNNPTGAEASDDFMLKLAQFVDAEPALTLAYDMAYSEMYFDRPPKSILEFTSNAVEFHSLSKIACATGYRVGFAVGETKRIAALIRMKEEVDSGTPLPFQSALAEALDSYQGIQAPQEILEQRIIFSRRKNLVTESLSEQGFDVFKSTSTFYVWFRVGDDEMPFISRALDRGLLLTPGTGFGRSGKGWVRASVTAPDETIEAAIDILQRLNRA